MNAKEIVDRILREMNLSPGSLRQKILRVLAQAGAPLTTNDLLMRALTDRVSASAKASLYRALSSLVKDEYIVREGGSYRQSYRLVTSSVERAIEEAIQRTRRRISGQMDTLSSGIDILRGLCQDDTVLSRASEAMYQALTGRRPSRRKSREDTSEDRAVFDSRIVEGLQRGDILRVALEVRDEFPASMETMLVQVGRVLSRGVELRVLLPPASIVRLNLFEALTRGIAEDHDAGARMDIRHRQSPSRFHQFVAKNNHAIILVISINPVITQYIPYEDCPELLEEMLESFDKEFSRATPIDVV